MAGYMDMTGRVYGDLTVIEYVDICSNRDRRWLARCVCGREIVVRGGHLRSGHTPTCRYSHESSYWLAHKWLRRERGSASSYQCRDCSSEAGTWALRNGCPGELRDDAGRYSMNLDDYDPMCYPCHMLMDAAHRLGDSCSKGHLRAEHEVRDKNGWRSCRACKREYMTKRRAELSQAV